MQSEMNELQVNQKIFLDGGWHGKENSGRIMYIVEKTQKASTNPKEKEKTVETFSFVVCNVGPGMLLLDKFFNNIFIIIIIILKKIKIRRKLDVCFNYLIDMT